MDHIVPRRVRPELELSLENLQALCKRCHSRKTKAESSPKVQEALLLGDLHLSERRMRALAGRAEWEGQQLVSAAVAHTG